MKTELSRRIQSVPALPQANHDYAVQFGNKKRDGAELQAFPFFYNFIRYPYQIGNTDSFGANQNEGIYRVTADAAEGPDGLALAPGGLLDIPIVMDNDYNFHLLYTKFGAYLRNEYTSSVFNNSEVLTIRLPSDGHALPDGTPIQFSSVGTTGYTVGITYYVVSSGNIAGTFLVALTLAGTPIYPAFEDTVTFTILGGASGIQTGSREYLSYSEGNPLLNADRNSRIPYWTELDVSLYMTSSASRDLYGGFQREPIGGATLESPIPILDLQGSQDGVGMLKTPFQLTKSATVGFRVRSRSIYPLRVYGHLFGYKITV